MPLPSATGGSARIQQYAVLERERNNARVLPIRLAGAPVTVSSGTYTLYTPSGSKAVDAAAVTGSAGAASYTVLAASVPSTLGYGDGYREEWALTLSTGETPIYRVQAVLARRALHCPITCEDLETRAPSLLRAFGSALASLQVFVDEAWNDLLQWLMRTTPFPDAVVEVDALRPHLLNAALGFAFRALASSGGQSAGNALEQAQHYEARALAERGSIAVRVDSDQDGLADSADKRGIAMVARGAAPQGMRSWQRCRRSW